MLHASLFKNVHSLFIYSPHRQYRDSQSKMYEPILKSVSALSLQGNW